MSMTGFLLQKLGLIVPATAPYRAILALQYNRGVRDAFGGMDRFYEEVSQLKR
jgi:hypothetical protein